MVGLAALAAAPALAHETAQFTPGVNVYWGQSGSNSLASYCESDSFEYVTIAFVNNSPEQDDSGLGYPGTNFAGHCASDVYMNGGRKSKLLSNCQFIAQDIPKCQALGKKVLLSIGGAWIDGTNYTVSTPGNGGKFADFLWGSFGPYNPSYAGPRPFGNASVDGFDFDIETKFGKLDLWRCSDSLNLIC
jgi:chitinase